MKIRIGICGYGNLGKGVLQAASIADDAEPIAVFTRRDPRALQASCPIEVRRVSELPQWQNRIDVLVLCGGSAKDLPNAAPALAKQFQTVDAFDTHAEIERYYQALACAAHDSGHLSLVCAGWDPGLFSVARSLFDACLPNGNNATFWGKGVSQGHSDALRRIDGVCDARAYTLPIPEAKAAAERGALSVTDPQKTHKRVCFVVARDGADHRKIADAVRNLPHYFAGYETEVKFLSQAELERDHAGLPHGGTVLYHGYTANGAHHKLALNLRSDSNPFLTGSILIAYARAVARLHERGRIGCLTPFDVSPADLSPHTSEELRKRFL